MNLEPMLLLTIAEERRRRLMEEAERERLVGRPPASKRLADALRAVAERLDESPSPSGRPGVGVGPSLP
jgi:hypothetical protein